MTQVTIPIDIQAVVKQLPLREKIRLVRQLEKDTWAVQLDQIVNRIRARRAVRQLSVGEISRIVEDVRKSRYARTSRRS